MIRRWLLLLGVILLFPNVIMAEDPKDEKGIYFVAMELAKAKCKCVSGFGLQCRQKDEATCMETETINFIKKLKEAREK